MKNNTVEEIWNVLKDKKKILIPLHPKPDGDSLGSCAAMKYVLEKEFDAEVKIISQDSLSKNLMEFSFAKEVEFEKRLTGIDLEEFQSVLFLDHGSLDECYPRDKIKNYLQEKLFIINIDHHETNDFYGDINYVDSGRTSCCSVLVDIFNDKGIKIDGEVSRRLLLGILTDSGFFHNDNTPDSIKKAAFLIEKGKINYQREFLIKIMSPTWQMKKFEGVLINNMKRKRIHGKEIIYSYITQKEIEKLQLNPAEVRLGISFLQEIKNTDIFITLSELKGEIKGSFRSNGIDTTLFSKEFGGGGHKEASGFYLEKMPVEKAWEKIFEVMEKVGMHKI